MSLSASILNPALQAYVHTLPNRIELDRHIERVGLGEQSGEQSGELVAELGAVLKTAEDHLYGFPGGVPWDDPFVRNFHALLRERHPWLDDESLGRIHGFSGWLCWHEGLNA